MRSDPFAVWPIWGLFAALMLTPMTASAEIKSMFRAFISGYLSTGEVVSSARLPDKCASWLDTAEDTELGDFTMNLRSNLAFETEMIFPAMLMEDQCVPAIEVLVGNSLYTFPVSLNVSIKDQSFGTLGSEPATVDSSYRDEFSFSPFECTFLGDGRIEGRLVLEQVLAKTFAGNLNLSLRAALGSDSCEQEAKPTICDCDAVNGDELTFLAQMPLMTVAIAETAESTELLNRQNNQALTEVGCLAELDELRAAGIPISPENVSEECWKIPQLADQPDFAAGRATSSSIQAIE